jgi:cell division septation protein DedD
MLRLVALVRTDLSEELIASFISQRYSKFTDSCHPDEGDVNFLLNVGSYKSHTA